MVFSKQPSEFHTFVPAFLRGFSPHVSSKHSIIQFTKEKFSVGRNPEAELCLLDVNISRNHCDFRLEGDHWTLTDRSSNGLSINGVRAKKTQKMTLDDGDEIILSSQPGYHWIFKIGTPDLSAEPPQKKQRIEVGLSEDRKSLKNTLSQMKKVAEVRMLRQKLAMDKIMRAGEQRTAEILAERDMLVSRLESQVKKQAAKDREARETLKRETEGKVDKEEIMKQFEETLRIEREKVEEENKTLLKNMEKRIQEEETLRQTEKIERDQQLLMLNIEKNEIERKFALEKEELENNLKELNERLDKENLTREAQDQEWQSRVDAIQRSLKEKLQEEKDAMEEAVAKEKEQSESVKKEMENQLKRLEGELEAERATYAGHMEMMMEEKRKQELEVRAQQQELESQQERLKVQQEEIESKMREASSSNDGTLAAAVGETLEREYQCPACLDLFICPIVLNCGHTFCWLCLAQWKNSNGRTRGDLGTCPQCRTPVIHENRVFTIDNAIDAFLEKLGPEKKKERLEKISERKGEGREVCLTFTVILFLAEEEKFRATATVSALNTARSSLGASPSQRSQQGQPRGRGAGPRGGGRGGRGGAHSRQPMNPIVIQDESSEESDDSDGDGDDDPFGFGRCFRCGECQMFVCSSSSDFHFIF